MTTFPATPAPEFSVVVVILAGGSHGGRMAAEGKKIRWRDGVEAVWTLIRYRFSR